jgi:hypothetical protein
MDRDGAWPTYAGSSHCITREHAASAGDSVAEVPRLTPYRFLHRAASERAASTCAPYLPDSS